MPNRDQRIAQPAPPPLGIVDIVGGDQPQPIVLGNPKQPGDQGSIYRQIVILQFDEELLFAKDRQQPLSRGLGGNPISPQEWCRQRPLSAPTERNQPQAVLRQLLPGERRFHLAQPFIRHRLTLCQP